MNLRTSIKTIKITIKITILLKTKKDIMSVMCIYGMQTANCLTSDVVEQITKSIVYCIVDGTSETIDYEVLRCNN